MVETVEVDELPVYYLQTGFSSVAAIEMAKKKNMLILEKEGLPEIRTFLILFVSLGDLA